MAEFRKNSQRRKLPRIFLSALLLLAAITTLLLAGVTPGPPFQVNTFTPGDQFLPAVGMNAAGQSVIVWTSQGQDGSGFGIFAQRYDANAVAQGPEFLVNTTTIGDQVEPAAVMDASGNFVIAWSGNGRGDPAGVFARRYNASGVAQGDEFLVNTTIPGQKAHPLLAMNASGGFIVVWETITAGTAGFFNSSGIFGRRYDASGTPLDAAEFQINTTPSASRFDSVSERPAHALAMDSVGNFVVVWGVQPPSGQPTQLNARLFHGDGTAQGPEFLVNTSNGSRPAAAMDGTGNFVVVYEPGFGQFFLANGARQGTEFPLDAGTVQRPAVEMNSAGKFVAAWRGRNPLTDGTAIFFRPFGAAGTPEDVAQVVSDVSVSESSPALKMDGTGNFLITWTNRDASGQGVFARRYAPLALSIGDVSVAKPASGTADAVFTVALSAASTQTVTVDFATADGTALSGSDYSANFGTLTFAPGETSKPIVVRIFGDTRLQPNKTFFINLSNPTGAAIVKAQGVGTILTNNPLPGVSINDVAATKPFSGTAEAFFTVSLSRPINQTVTVDFATGDGTAAAGADYVAQTGTLTFLAGQTTKGISIVINGGTAPGPDKTFSINLSNPTTATLAKALGVGTILNFQSTPPIIRANEFLVNTTTAGSQWQAAIGMNASGQFVIAWSLGVPGAFEGIFAQRFNADGSRAGSEFRVDDLAHVPPTNDSNGRCTALPRRRQAGVGMDASGNFVIVWTTAGSNSGDQFDEFYTFSNVCAQRYRADGTPLGSNFLVDTNFNTFHSQDPSIGMYGNGNFVIAWSDDSARVIFFKRFDSTGAVLDSTVGTVPCRNTFTGADERCDIRANSITTGTHPSVAVNPGVPVCPPGQVCSAPPTDFYIAWQGGNSVSSGIFARGFSGGNALPLGVEFRVSADPVSSTAAPVVSTDEGGNFVTVWEEFGGTPGIRARRFNNCTGPAPPGSGCTPALGNQFQANSTTFTSHRPTVGMGPEGNFVVAWDGFETSTSSTSLIFARRFDANQTTQGSEFRVNELPRDSFRPAARIDGGGNFLVAWEGAAFAGASHIFARRFVPGRALSIDDVRVAAGASGTIDGTFTVTLSAATNQTVTVDFATADGTAIAGADYVGNSGTLTFAPGQIRNSIVVHVHGDPLLQAFKTFFVNLSNVRGGGATIAKAQGRGTITNDQPAQTLSINDVTLTKPASGTAPAIFSVALSAASSQMVTVDFATADGTAAAGTQYVAQSGTLAFGPGETLKTISIVINGTTTVEPDKTFFVNLSNATGAAIAKTQGVGTIQSLVQIVVNETITVTDAPSVLPSAMIGVAENITVTDVPAVQPSAMIGVAENIVVTDAPSVLPSAMIGVAENIMVQDATQVLPLDFNFGAIAPLTITAGTSASTTVTVNPVNGFSSAVNLSVSGQPAGVTASLSANPVTPSGGNPASSVLNVSLPSFIAPSNFTLTVTGTSDSLSHSTTANITVTTTPSSISKLIGDLLVAGCIDNAGIGNALTSKISAAQSATNLKTAINVLTAFENQVQAQSGKHIATSCVIAGAAFNPVSVLLLDVQGVIDSLKVSLIPDPITGYVVDANGMGVAGATVSILNSGGSTVAVATTDITGFYFLATTGVLTPGATYTVGVTGFPAGFASAAPPNQAFTWQGTAITLSNFVLN
jgi:hypothetical protein